MDTIQQRIEIFENAAMISHVEAELLDTWADILRKEIPGIKSENLERIITHSAMMMKRKKDQETIDPLSDEIYQTIMDSEQYPTAVCLFEKMKEHYSANEVEKRYLILHICTCLSRED